MAKRRIKTPKQLAPFSYPDRIGIQFYQSIEPILTRMFEETRASIMALMNKTDSTLVQNSALSEQLKAVLDNLSRKYEATLSFQLDTASRDWAQAVNFSSLSKAEKLAAQTGITIQPNQLVNEMGDFIKFATQQNVGLFKTIAPHYFANVEKTVIDSILRGDGIAQLNDYFEQYSNGEKNYAKNRAMDQTRKFYTSLNVERMDRLGIKKVRWVHSHGANAPRKLHQELDGQVFNLSDPPFIGIMYKQRVYGWGGNLPYCFTGSTKFFLSNGCRNAWRFWYEGRIIHLTVNGNVIEVTPQHPILTTKGWLRADEINEGDYLISSESYNIGMIDNKINDSVTTFDDFFFSNKSRCKTDSGFKFNFHGDIPNGDVDSISFVNDYLPSWTKTISDKQIEQLILTFSNSDIDSLIFSVVSKFIDSSYSCSFGELYSFFCSELAHSDIIGNASISENNAIALKYSCDSLSCAIKIISELKNAQSEAVLFYNLIGLSIDRILLDSSRDNITKSLFESLRKSCSAELINSAKLSQGHSPVKGLFRVDKKIVSVFSGHVYTIESYNGWFSVSPTGIISKNCRCTIAPVFDFSEKEK